MVDSVGEYVITKNDFTKIVTHNVKMLLAGGVSLTVLLRKKHNRTCSIISLKKRRENTRGSKMKRYKLSKMIGDGTFGSVVRAVNTETGEVVR